MSRNDPPDPIDVLVGEQIKLRRVALGLNQSRLGQAIGVTFQQVQKYERGTNRVSASMLHRIAGALGCRIADLFPGGGDAPEGAVTDPVIRQTIHALAGLSDEHRRLVLSVARALGPGSGACAT